MADFCTWHKADKIVTKGDTHMMQCTAALCCILTLFLLMRMLSLQLYTWMQPSSVPSHMVGCAKPSSAGAVPGGATVPAPAALLPGAVPRAVPGAAAGGTSAFPLLWAAAEPQGTAGALACESAVLERSRSSGADPESLSSSNSSDELLLQEQQRTNVVKHIKTTRPKGPAPALAGSRYLSRWRFRPVLSVSSTDMLMPALLLVSWAWLEFWLGGLD